MVIEEVVSNVSELVSVLPPSVLAKIEGLVIIFKAVGIAVIIYVLYILVTGFFMFRRIKRMRHIEKKVDSIDKKLDRLLKDKKKKK